jgi:hypothetical protein
MAAFEQDAVNAEVGRLYQLPLDQFIKARNELAKRVGGGEASAIRARAKPNVLAWALNQLYWSKKETFDRLVAAAARLRATQAEALLGKRTDLRAPGEAHREAIREALQQTVEILRAAGHPATPDAIRELTGALEALPWKEPGRLVRPPAASGFDALAGLPVAPEPPLKAEATGAREKARKEWAAPRTRHADISGVAAQRERAAALKTARAAVQAARRDEAQAASHLERAEKEVKAAAAREEAARQALREAERVRAGADEEKRTVAAALDAARRASAEATRRLELLQRGRPQ